MKLISPVFRARRGSAIVLLMSPREAKESAIMKDFQDKELLLEENLLAIVERKTSSSEGAKVRLLK